MVLDYPNDLRYKDSHEYIRLDGETATLGLSAFAIDQLGDIVFIELPDVGGNLEKGQTFGTVESVKAVEEIYAPLSGKVLERNEDVIASPEILKEDPYHSGWLVKVKINDFTELDDSLSAPEYYALLEIQ
ncbi:MAG: glycine cleavage system protein GcvH [Synechococcales bacterium]|nr:glycine cleavage system protein GcvH [Cyanobacteria bacterium REEB444]MEB3124695.1 glycine cleavage system protein GcvH [Synechococcales bacterium]